MKPVLPLIKKHCLSNPNIEMCGFVVCSKLDYIVIPARNISPNPEHYFEIDSLEYIKAKYKGRIEAIYHSHIVDCPISFYDKYNAEQLCCDYIMYCLPTDKFELYHYCGKTYSYLGRRFEMGRFDCLTLVIDFYKEELGIQLNNYFSERGADFFLKERSIMKEAKYLDLIKKEGFKILDAATPLKVNDVLFCFNDNNSSFPSHFAVYLGNNRILQQLNNYPSTITELDKNAKDKILYVLRHKNYE